MPAHEPRPLIGIPANRLLHPENRSHAYSVGEKYVESVMVGAGGLPMLLPALGDVWDFDDLAARLDGVLLTGARANVEPHHYGGPPFPDDEIRDPARDATVLPLIRKCVGT